MFSYGNIDDKKVLFSCLCRSPSQDQDRFEEWSNDLNLLLSNVSATL